MRGLCSSAHHLQPPGARHHRLQGRRLLELPPRAAAVAVGRDGTQQLGRPNLAAGAGRSRAADGRVVGGLRRCSYLLQSAHRYPGLSANRRSAPLYPAPDPPAGLPAAPGDRLARGTGGGDQWHHSADPAGWVSDPEQAGAGQAAADLRAQRRHSGAGAFRHYRRSGRHRQPGWGRRQQRAAERAGHQREGRRPPAAPAARLGRRHQHRLSACHRADAGADP